MIVRTGYWNDEKEGKSSVAKRIVIVGASSAIAEQCARCWVQTEGVHLVLVGRSAQRLEAIADDLRVRGNDVTTEVRVLDFESAPAIDAWAREIFSNGKVDIALIAHGVLPDQQACQNDINLAGKALSINGVSPVLFAERLVDGMTRTGGGALAIIGSVAGDRGRRSNYVYGAAKALVDVYAQGLQHRLAGSKISLTLVKPGPTDTPMTAHLQREGAKLASAARVARDIVSAIDAARPVVYTPWKWRLIMAVIRNLPKTVFDRLDI